tara:strand:+ start:452 stop:1180 length:729 start_codon:yes stop_codon:yes gene_type:complete
MKTLQRSLIVVLGSFLLSSCATLKQHGMITDQQTGLQYGANVERSFFIDPSQFKNRKIKITARNVSGDFSYNIRAFVSNLENSFSEKGYEISKGDDFGIKFDAVIEYSGHAQQNLASQYSFLGATGGGIIGYRSKADAGTAIGVVSGATLGAIIGSYITDDTYIIVAKVTIGLNETKESDGKSITFGSSPKLQKENIHRGIKRFKEVGSTRMAVYAGGRNVNQSQIVGGVKQRLLSIISDII